MSAALDSASLDMAARTLGRARAAFERRPADRGLELAYERARADFEAARADSEKRRADAAETRRASLRAEIGRVRREFDDRLKAVMARARPKRRRARGQADAPLFEGRAG